MWKKLKEVLELDLYNQGLYDINNVKEYDYKRFIIFSKIILKLYSEVKNAN